MKLINTQKYKNRPDILLLVMAFIMSACFAVWNVLLNNFVIEVASFTGKEIGLLQTFREIPGFLAFTAIYLLLFIREQWFAYLFLAIMCLGIAITGHFTSTYGLYFTTIIMSIGFHYFETVNQSLTLQWIDKDKTAHFMGKALSIKGFASLSAYGFVWILMQVFNVSYYFIYLSVGIFGFIATIYIWKHFQSFDGGHPQQKRFLLKKRYWLFYILTFLSGARRQIFLVFAGFMMVEKFGYTVANISLLFMINYVFNILFAPKIGKFIAKIGERKALIIEYIGLIIVFSSYAFVESSEIAATLYVIDHLFFALAIAVKTYFQKIASPEDIAATASVSFTINHIAAVIIPTILGILWLYSNGLVFAIGAGFAVISLICATLIPNKPSIGNETRALEKLNTGFIAK